MSLLELRLPVVPARAIEMLAGASAPLALFVIGASLNGLKVGGMAGRMLDPMQAKPEVTIASWVGSFNH